MSGLQLKWSLAYQKLVHQDPNTPNINKFVILWERYYIKIGRSDRKERTVNTWSGH